jgi:(p)ppGpp synthase/HD superfamily hydrolase
MDEVLKLVTAFARQAHGDQRRKFADEPYVNHLVRVMETCQQYSSDIAVLSAALLHDTLEDTGTSIVEIRNFLLPLLGEDKTERTVKLVEELTDVYTKKKYPQWNRRTRRTKETVRLSKTSPDAQTIKYADILDNSLDIHKAESDFTRVFLFECRDILKTIPAGDKALYQKAIETVQQCIEELA